MAAKRKTKSRKKPSTRRKKTTRKTTKTKRKTTKKSGGKKKAFGGYAISFSGRTETVEQVFGKGNVTPSEMTKKLWKFIKGKKLANR